MKFELESSKNMTAFKESWNHFVVNAASKERSAYSTHNCFFGTQKEQELILYYHKESGTDLLTTRFIGTIEETETGTKISGVFTKTKNALIFLWFMVVMMLLGGIAMIIQNQLQQSLLLFGLSIIAFIMIKVTPKESIERLKRALVKIATEEYNM